MFAIEPLTFFLAFAGFAGLTWCSAAAARRRSRRPVLAVTVTVIVIHVLLVWVFRYRGSFEQATRNGYAGFVIFHAALISLVLSNFLAPARARICVMLSFFIVCVGAMGAVFRYDDVAFYKWPVVLCAALGTAATVVGLVGKVKSMK